MKAQLFLLLAVCLYSQVRCLHFRPFDEEFTCLQKPIGPIKVDPVYEYVALRRWTAKDTDQIKESGLSAIGFVFTTAYNSIDYNQRFFEQIGEKAQSKFYHKQNRPTSYLYKYNSDNFGLSIQQFQSLFGQSTVYIYKVNQDYKLITLKFSAKGSPKQIGGWSILVDLDKQRSLYQFPLQEHLYNKISDLIKEKQISTKDVVSAFKISEQDLAKHIMLSLQKSPQINTSFPIQFQASIVTLAPGQKFIIQQIKMDYSKFIRIIDQVEDRSNCTQ